MASSMFSTEDTIVAVATPPGRGGLGVVRLSGPRALEFATGLITYPGPLTPRHATFTTIRVSTAHGGTEISRVVDHAVATFFPGPASYTGDDVVELSAHGSPVVLQAIVAAAARAGARLARPGEFTLRAFLNGRIDLPQAEAVADLIDAVTPLQAQAAFDQLQGTLTRAIADIDAELFDLVARLEASVDFPEEGYHFIEPGALVDALVQVRTRLTALVARGRQGRVIREGRVVALVGGPNVGKSSLFNALVGASRAIVTPLPGTTRDLVSEAVDIEGIRVTLVDTAGLRETTDAIEREGVSRSREAARVADLVVVVRDGTVPEVPAHCADSMYEAPSAPMLRVDNKCDLPGFVACAGALAVSAIEGTGQRELRMRIAGELGATFSGDCPEITNTRHLELLERADLSVGRALLAVQRAGGALSEEFVLADLQEARLCLEEITGRRTSTDLLEHIFTRFCIGK
ncbi:MAG: tRNA uridine-5-carboxymethylaminomethyl(34) synthesis GTPase MnmE [Acidimicrobiia bacterium]|nr:tRNA uridine-5-carboxymethylaminomethyl(34) synthesis GTPase MnmE [Acidimicrobiia bacterium]